MDLIEDPSDHRPEVYRRFHGAVIADAGLRADYEAIVRDRGRSQLRKWLDAAWEKRIEIELADRSGSLLPSVPPASDHWAELAGLAHPSQRLLAPPVQSLLSDLARTLGRHPGAVCRKQGALLEQARALDDAALRLAAVRTSLLTDKGTPRKALEGVAGMSEAVVLLERLADACEQQVAHGEHLRMVRLSRALFTEFAAYKRSRGLADMLDLERFALAVLRDATLAGWVQERLDAKVRHLLVDEFQDTNPLQWQALHAWLAGYAGAGGGASGQRPPGIFIVGDPKQSIYRFRGAEPRVFSAARDFVVQGLGGNLLTCDHTRRNAPEVLQALNGVFDQAQADGHYEGFRPHTTEEPSSPHAGVFVLERVLRPERLSPAAAADDGWRDSLTTPRVEPDELLREQEAARVADAIAALADAGMAPRDIQVLCRKRQSLRLLEHALAKRQLPCAAAEDTALIESPEARDLAALLDVLASPSHKLSLAHALRSPVFGASDEDLVAIAAASAEHRDWWRGLRELASPSDALARARELLERWRQAAQRLPPHDLLDLVVAEGEVRQRTAAAVPPVQRAAALLAIDAMLHQALTLDGARYATPYNFVRALKRRALLVPAPLQPEAVQLLTVHGAKGLEAEAVFVMDADPKPQNPETATLLVDWPVDAEAPRHCAFLYSESRCPPSLRGMLLRESTAREREELNGLYVAMTRAKRRLVISATESQQASAAPSWWQRLQPWAAPLQVAPAAVRHRDEATRPAVLADVPAWNRMLAPGATPSAAAAAVDDVASRLGQAVHRVLEWAAVGADPDLPRLAQAAAGEFRADAREVGRLAGRIWRSPACLRFFAGPQLLWSGNEVPVSEGGEMLRIDRLVALAEGGGRAWWVLDYKLQHAPEALPAYREQMARYRRAVQALQPGEPVHAAFITGAGEVIEQD
jgi:ATP-dependent helicase/nuclease subunit A